MLQEEVYQRLTEVARKVFGDPEVDLRPESTSADVEGWDSLSHIQLIVAVEKTFGIKFATAEIAQFQNVGQLAEMILRKAG